MHGNLINALRGWTPSSNVAFAPQHPLVRALKREYSPPISVERLNQIVRYEPETGEFYWLEPAQGRTVGGKLGRAVTTQGYRKLHIEGREYLAQHVAWALSTGEWPPVDRIVDHHDRDKLNNRWLNLRLATNAENRRNASFRKNNTSGYRGVFWHPQTGKWNAKINVNGRGRSLGLFVDPEDASEAYQKAQLRFHGAFATSDVRANAKPTLH